MSKQTPKFFLQRKIQTPRGETYGNDYVWEIKEIFTTPSGAKAFLYRGKLYELWEYKKYGEVFAKKKTGRVAKYRFRDYSSIKEIQQAISKTTGGRL